MNLSDWRASRKRTKTITLPSGLEVEVQPVPMQAFLRSSIPDSLTPVVSSMFETGLIPPAKTLAEIRSFYDLLDSVALCAIVSPPVVRGEAGPDELSIEELSEGDKGELLALLGVTAKAFEAFHPAAAVDVGVVLPGESDEPGAE